jgi:adenylate cyclase, class 2
MNTGKGLFVKPLEIEVKFHLKDAESFQHRLPAWGAEFKSYAHETNIRYENHDNSLYRQKILLRLRRADIFTLTYKSKPHKSDPDFKVHHEVEVIINDFEAMRQILESIGFHPAQVYEKKRATWRINNTLLCVDQMPYGNFIEIEGAPDNIRQAAMELGFEWKDRILFNYLEIFETLKRQLRLQFSDVTFDHFKNIRVDFNQYLYLFTAHSG